MFSCLSYGALSSYFFLSSDKAKFKNLVFRGFQSKRKKTNKLSLPVTFVTHMIKRKLNCLLTCLLWFKSGLPSLGVWPTIQLPQSFVGGDFIGIWEQRLKKKKRKKKFHNNCKQTLALVKDCLVYIPEVAGNILSE